jgi:hypothetical protein
MAQFVTINSGPNLLEVPIVNEVTKETDSVFVQSGGRVSLPAGFCVETSYLRKNPKLTQVNRESFEAQKTLLNNRASYFKQAIAQKTPVPAPVVAAPVPAPAPAPAEQTSSKKN